MNWQSIVGSLASVAVVIGPVALAHYKKLRTVLTVVMQILESVQKAEQSTTNTAAASPQTRPGSGMVDGA